MPAAATWKLWFASLPDYVAGNKDSAVYAGAWSQETDAAAKIQLLVSDPGTVILAANSNRKIIAAHSFRNFGGTPVCLTNKFGCLVSGGTSLCPDHPYQRNNHHCQLWHCYPYHPNHLRVSNSPGNPGSGTPRCQQQSHLQGRMCHILGHTMARQSGHGHRYQRPLRTHPYCHHCSDCLQRPASRQCLIPH